MSLTDDLYAALATGDVDTLRRLLAPDLQATFTAGMPVGGGTHDGLDATMQDGWFAMGKQFRVRAVPERSWRDGDTLIVLGTYHGRARESGTKFAASFAHFWTFGEDDVITAITQVTDSASWAAAQ